MRLTVELDGRPAEVEVAGDLASVRLGGRSYPVRVVERRPTRLVLEIAGETVTVDGWPEGLTAPPGPLDVNGERHRVVVTVVEPGVLHPASPSIAGGPAPAEAAAPPVPAAPVRPGAVAILPPMPGRVVAVKVREGDRVHQGDLLVVLEAMKMRNEVTAPIDGVVHDVRVREGSNVRAREAMLTVAPA